MMGARVASRRDGERNPRAKLSDHECELIRELKDDGLGTRRIAKIMETPRRTVRDIISFRRRASWRCDGKGG